MAALAATACSPASSESPSQAPSSSDRPNPLAGQRFYVNPQGHAVEQVRRWRQRSRTRDAARLRPLAEQPTATWFAGAEADPFARAQALTTAAARAGRTALVTVYDVPHRDCGQYSSGGAADADAYRRYVGAVAAGLGERPAAVVLEPDAVAHAVEGCPAAGDPQARYRLLGEAVDVLRKQPRTHVYLDAGNASWVEDVGALAGALRASGVERASGFALNVSNFETTQASVDYGRRVSAALGGAHFVVDTGRNGNGAPPEQPSHRQWCNPPGRALGHVPTTSTGTPLVDAFAWVKQPGDSDGTCAPGQPSAGTWWPANALQLAATARAGSPATGR